jgi:hypothetical protein
VLTWCAVALLVAAVAVAAHWWRRRRDALGRPRGFPFVSVGLLAVAGVLGLVPGLQHARLEHRLADAASALTGRRVEVHCQTLGEAFVDTDGHLGYVAWGPDGVPEARTTIKREPCAALDAYLGSGHAAPTDVEVQAVHVLSHESRHMAGVTDEALAECQAMQRDAMAARLLGASVAQARRVARYYWMVFYPRMPDDYRASACAPGAAWDEHLPDAPWAPLTAG